MKYMFILLYTFRINATCEIAESVPYKFPDNSIKNGPYINQSHFTCFDYFLGPDKIGHEEYCRDGKIIILQVLYKNGEKSGIERNWYLSGSIRSSKDFIGGELNGEWKEWSENGFLEGDSKFDHGSGKRIVHYDNGNTKLYEEYVNSVVNGYHREYYKSGKLHTAIKMKRSLPDEYGYVFAEDGKIEQYYECSSDGQLNGYLITNEDSKSPRLRWYSYDVVIWDSDSGMPPPESLQGKELDPEKAYNSIKILPEYVGKKANSVATK